jgi:hypothetical protein
MKKSLRFAALLLLALAMAVPAIAHEAGHGVTSPTDNLQEAMEPQFPVWSYAVLLADHMPGMKGAAARVSGAYDTTLYAVSYTRTDTGERTENHKWVIHEEIEGHGDMPYAVGDNVMLMAGHISGIGGEGAEAEITQVLPGVAYMVDYLPTDGSEPVVYHQWVSGEELAALPAVALPQGK